MSQTTKPTRCPECGAPVRTYMVTSTTDPDDVEPAAVCTNYECGYEY